MALFYRFVPVISVFFLLLSAGCSTSPDRDGGGTRYYQFVHKDGEEVYAFIAKTSDPGVIARVEEELARPFEERSLHINGRIARGDGGHNTGWSWHFIPGEWDLAEISTEVCDGRPSMVEEELDYWVDGVGRFCPWSSRVKEEVKVE